MKKIFVLLCFIILCIPFVYTVVSYFSNQKGDSEKFVIVDINMENYTDYISIESTNNAIDANGNLIENPCVVIASKVYTDGLYFISASESTWDIQFTNKDTGIGEIGSTPLGRVLEDISNPAFVKITNIQGKYKFVKSEYVEEYVFENGIRRIKLKDGRQQEIIFENIVLDYTKPY